MSDVLPSLVAALAGRYSIARELGRGGMATVFLAEDLKHGRKVALKVFRPEIALALGVDRFVREIEIAARLQHPHILALYDSGEAAGLLYYVMPFVEGLSLRQRLERERQLPIADVVRITREVSQALAHAHARGIVHRDIKPENILLTADGALLADFGIAHAMEDSGRERLTSAGFALGTPTYMSPEQGMGGSLDPRSDQYSLACVTYEMLGGEPPFTGSNSAALLARHTVDPVPRLRTLRGTVPEPMESAIVRALAKAPADRYPSVGDYAADVAQTSTAPQPLVPQPAWRGRRLAVAGALLLLLALGAFLLRPLIGGRAGGAAAEDARPRLAVLPFESIGHSDDAFVADGVSDEITTRVAGLSGLVVIARSSVAGMLRAGKTVAELARDLRVQYVLTGSVKTDRQADGSAQVRVTPQLVRTMDEVAVWSPTGYQAALAPGEMLGVLSQIADQVARALNVSLLFPEQTALAARPTDDLQAYEAYLRGNAYSAQSFAEEPWRKAIEMYDAAVRQDPGFALAWARLSQAQTRYFYNIDRSASRVTQARAAADRALALDSTLVEGRLAIGLLHYLAYRDFDSAEREFEALRRTRPNDSEVLSYLATLQRRRGNFSDAVEALDRATELDPHSSLYAIELASTHMMQRDFREAERELDRILGVVPDALLPRILQSYLYWTWQGDLERARGALRRALASHRMSQLLTQMLPLNPQYILTMGAEFRDSLLALRSETTPVNPGFLFLAKGLAHQRQNDPRARVYFDSALTVWEPLARAQPQEWTFHSLLGITYAGLGREAEALAEGRAAIERMPLSRDAQAGSYPLTSMVTIAILSGELDTALAYLRPLLEHPSQISPNLVWRDPLFAPLRERPGFRALVR